VRHGHLEQKLPTAAALKSKNSNWPAPEMLQWSTGSAKIIQKNMRLHVLSDLHQEFAPYRPRLMGLMSLSWPRHAYGAERDTLGSKGV